MDKGSLEGQMSTTDYKDQNVTHKDILTKQKESNQREPIPVNAIQSTATRIMKNGL